MKNLTIQCFSFHEMLFKNEFSFMYQSIDVSRCFSLNKSCQPAPVKRKIGSTKTPKNLKQVLSPAPARTVELEQKLDGIIQLLQTSQAVRDGFPNLAKELGSLSSRNAVPALAANEMPLTPEESYVPTITDSSTGPPSLKSPELSKRSDLAWLIGNELEFEECLELYRSEMVPIFPNVPLSPQETIDTMCEKRPFLSFVIYAIGCKHLQRQIKLVKEVRAMFGQELIAEGNKDLDLLQALIVYSSWGLTWLVAKPITNFIVQLGLSLISDLGIDKPDIRDQERQTMLNHVGWSSYPKPIGHCLVRGPRTLEDRRTLVSMFLTSSM
jgi:hypothetical protein